MVLKPIKECNLSESELLGAVLIKGWQALDIETGAFLSRSNGRNSYGELRYVLILPNKSVEERGGLFASYDWDYPKGRKFIRAHSESEAIEIANKKLEKMLKANAA